MKKMQKFLRDEQIEKDETENWINGLIFELI